MEISTKTLHFIEEHREDDTRTLALQSKKYPDVDMAAAVTQIAGRQVAARKIPSWYPVSALWYPPHLSMEQCSSEATALYKASLLEGDTFADLTGGFGIDCSFISRNFKQADYVERQSGLCELALHNFPLLGLVPRRSMISSKLYFIFLFYLCYFFYLYRINLLYES